MNHSASVSSFSLVTTTIHVPKTLEAYFENFQKFGHTNVVCFVIGDKKTPPEVADFCRQLSRRFKYEVRYLDLEAQKQYLKSFPDLWEFLPFNSIQRRNIGFLLAYQAGSEVIVTIDDDNWVTEDDFLGCHGAVSREVSLPILSSASGWINVCRFLTEEAGQPFYHRGFPAGKRWIESPIMESVGRGRVVVNAGLWLGDPDVDAIARLHRTLSVTGIQFDGLRRFALGVGTWSPFGSQNTALWREVLPAFFLNPYVGRYDDIWASYVVRRIADHMGHLVSYGLPLVRQVRNPHDLWEDLEMEKLGWQLTPSFIRALRKCSLTSTSYAEATTELTGQLVEALQEDPTFTVHRTTLKRIDRGLRLWMNVFQMLESR
jgi:hypothetical protein